MEKTMASFPDLRPGSRLAKAKGVAVRRSGSLRLLAVSAALLLTAFIAVSELATLRGPKAHDASAYLTRELGPPLGSASLVRRPERGISVDVGKRSGFSVARAGGGSITLSAKGAGRAPWQHFANGVMRRTPFGHETVTVGPGQAEQFLTVARRQGARTWEWNLGTTLEPRSLPNGTIDLFEA